MTVKPFSERVEALLRELEEARCWRVEGTTRAYDHGECSGSVQGALDMALMDTLELIRKRLL